MKYIEIALLLMIALLGIAKDLSSPYIARHRVLLIIILTIALFLVAVVGALLEKKENERSAVDAQKNRTTGTLVSQRKVNAIHAVLAFGGTSSRVACAMEGPAIYIYGDPIILKMVNGQAQISCMVRDSDGATIVAITDNEWSIQKTRCFDFNFNSNSLEIKNSKNEVVFQVRVDGDIVSMSGVFYPSSASPMDSKVARELGRQSNEKRGPVFLHPWIHQEDGRRESLFAYPRTEHLGEFSPIVGKNAEINEAKINTVYIPTGTYLLKRSLVLDNDNTRILGQLSELPEPEGSATNRVTPKQ